jgi:hypothetical protein
MNLMLGFVAWMYGQILPFLIWVIVLECLALGFYLAARNPDRIVARHALSWLTVSDLIFAVPALGAAVWSGVLMPWSLLGLSTIWLVIMCIQIWIAFTIPLPRQASASYATFALDGRSERLRLGQRLDRLVSIYLFSVLSSIGFGGMLIFYVIGDQPKLLFFLAIMAMGVAAGFSAQTSILALSWRMRHLPRYRAKDAPSDTAPAPDHAGAG